MSFRAIFFAALATAMTTSICLAHDGHGHSPDQGQTLSHYLSEPIHLAEILTIAVAAGAIGYLVKQRRQSLRHP